jgi:hypothetical protein
MINKVPYYLSTYVNENKISSSNFVKTNGCCITTETRIFPQWIAKFLVNTEVGLL